MVSMESHGDDTASKPVVLEKESQPFVDAFGGCPKLKEVPWVILDFCLEHFLGCLHVSPNLGFGVKTMIMSSWAGET